jgi:hypothetical protein
MNAGIIRGTNFSWLGLAEGGDGFVLISSATLRFAACLLRAMYRRERCRRNAPRSTKQAPRANIILRFVEKVINEKWRASPTLSFAVQSEGEPKQNKTLCVTESGITDSSLTSELYWKIAADISDKQNLRTHCDERLGNQKRIFRSSRRLRRSVSQSSEF